MERRNFLKLIGAGGAATAIGGAYLWHESHDTTPGLDTVLMEDFDISKLNLVTTSIFDDEYNSYKVKVPNEEGKLRTIGIEKLIYQTINSDPIKPFITPKMTPVVPRRVDSAE